MSARVSPPEVLHGIDANDATGPGFITPGWNYRQTREGEM